MEEIIDRVMFQVENSGFAEKLSAGMVITGGGALMRHLPQLIKFRTGMDVRVGYPNENLSGDKNQEVNHPMYSTSVGLILKGYEFNKHLQKPVEVPVTEPEPEEVEVKKDPRKWGFFKNVFNEFFDEKGSSM